ncbi:MAG: hypothetical protein ACFFA4_08365 [Promethearchaeota archaeon]
MAEIDPKKLRNLPGWEDDAPIPLCMGGDYRALTFCCKPGYSLTFAFKCKRDEKLRELGLSPEEFVRIKEEFSKENDWKSELVCFGSLSYCCMRRDGCPKRDFALTERYPDKNLEDIMRLYFQKKKELSRRILGRIKSVEGMKKVKPFLELF